MRRLTGSLENERELLRKMRTEARIVTVEQRADMLYELRGEIHIRLEPSQLGLHPEDKEGAGVNVNYERGRLRDLSGPHYDTILLYNPSREDAEHHTEVQRVLDGVPI